jgi:hypothetical protein
MGQHTHRHSPSLVLSTNATPATCSMLDSLHENKMIEVGSHKRLSETASLQLALASECLRRAHKVWYAQYILYSINEGQIIEKGGCL